MADFRPETNLPVNGIAPTIRSCLGFRARVWVRISFGDRVRILSLLLVQKNRAIPIRRIALQVDSILPAQQIVAVQVADGRL